MKAKVQKNTVVAGAALGTIAFVTVLSLMPPQDLPDTKKWFIDIPFGDKIVHFCFYFCMISTIRFAKTYISGYAKACPWRLLAFAAAYGGAIELLQGQYFERSADVWDEAANILGAAAAIWLIPQRWHERLADRLDRKTSTDEP